jgi:hypothetical protein
MALLQQLLEKVSEKACRTAKGVPAASVLTAKMMEHNDRRSDRVGVLAGLAVQLLNEGSTDGRHGRHSVSDDASAVAVNQYQVGIGRRGGQPGLESIHLHQVLALGAGVESWVTDAARYEGQCIKGGMLRHVERR